MTIFKSKPGWKLATAAICAVVTVGAFAASAVAKDWGKFEVDGRRSGYTYMTDETRAVQNDDFENPGMLWVENGESLWSKTMGSNGKSCASCHADADKDMKGVSPSYPKFNAKIGKMETLEQKVNRELVEKLGAKAEKFDSKTMLSLTTYIGHISNGMPVNVKVDGPAKPFFEKGKAFYYQRRGQLNMACKHCHEDFAGNLIRANMLSEGQINGFPTYRLKWQKPGSVHRRFKGCNKNVRAKPYKAGSDEYVNLELYVKWRGRGLPTETPAVRN
jgi:sulfur-oxidizing protein SoxA